jgi:IgA Peptidase M64
MSGSKWLSLGVAGTLGLIPACSSEDGGVSASPNHSSGTTNGGAGSSQGSGGSSVTGTAGNDSTGSSGVGGADPGAAGTNMSSDGGPGAGTGGASVVPPPLPDGGPIDYKLDCGASGIAIEGHGPPDNRINYVIVGDCYTQADIDAGLFLQHVKKMIDDPTRKPAAGRFLEAQEPYRRYRNFVNICALKTPSIDSVCGTAAKNTAFDGYGNTQTRLGYINNTKVNSAIKTLLPPAIMVDWKGIVLNDNQWWNSGGNPMIWSGGHVDAALAAQHEGGHGFFNLADEYGGACTGTQPEPRRINVTASQSTTTGKWVNWLNTTQTSPAPGTGMQGFFEGGEYCDKGVWRPSSQSVMNSLWASSQYNSISLENAVRSIYKLVKPIDSSTAATVTAPQVLEVKVIDPAVIRIDWSVDGKVVAASGGATFDVGAKGLAKGSHTISARAYDDTPWVKGDRVAAATGALVESVTWTIAVP